MSEVLTDDSIMWFGDYKGRKLVNVPASYLLYIYNNNKAFGKLKDYIEDNLQVLEVEFENEKRKSR